MLLMDWLDPLRTAWNLTPPPRKQHPRRNRSPGFATAAEVCEVRNMLSGSLLAMAADGVSIGLQSFQETPPLMGDHDDPLETFSVVQPDDSDFTLEESMNSVAQTQDTSNLKPSDDVVGGILPDVMDTLLSSPLNEPVAPSPVAEFTPLPTSSTPLETSPGPDSGSGALGSPPPMSLGSGGMQSGTSPSSGDQSTPTGLMSGPAPATSPDATTTSLQTFTTLTTTNSPPVANYDDVSLGEIPARASMFWRTTPIQTVTRFSSPMSRRAAAERSASQRTKLAISLIKIIRDRTNSATPSAMGMAARPRPTSTSP